MTTTELNTLVNAAEHDNIEAIVQLCEHYLSDYAKIRTRHTLDGIYAQFIKLFWTQLKKQFPKFITAEPQLRENALDFQSEPDIAKMQSLIKSTLEVAKKSSNEDYKECSLMTQRVFATLSVQLPELLKLYIGEYASSAAVKQITSAFISAPSFGTLVEMVKAFVAFGKNTIETDRTIAQLYRLFTRYGDVKNLASSDSLEQRIAKLANKTGLKEEHIHAIKKYEAECGNIDSMIMLGTIYEYGQGVEVDESLAEQWYLRAMSAGSRMGQEMLDKLRAKQTTRKELELKESQIREQAKNAEFERMWKVNMDLQKMKLEKQKSEEQVRHNAELEELERQRIAELKRANLPPEERQVRVRFDYRLSNEWFKDSCAMSRSAYNALLTGGLPSIINFVKSRFTYGMSVSEAYMGEPIEID